MRIECPGCKLLIESSNQTTHPYIGASAGCWKLYGELLAREYGNPEYMKAHRLTVDTYAAQHPGKEERRSTQSVNSHLVALYLLIEKNLEAGFVTTAIGKIIAAESKNFQWLDPPSNLGNVNVTDVLKAKNSTEHFQMVSYWAEEVWQCWSSYHHYIAELANKL